MCDFGSAYRAEETTGTWFGFAQADVYLYRVRLTARASGDGAYSSYTSGPPTYFKIADWKLTGKNGLYLQMAPGSGISRVEGNFATDSMFLGVVYGTTGWTNSVEFYKEVPFERRMEALRTEMNEQSNGQAKGSVQTNSVFSKPIKSR
jgi:hypothetical protein